MKFPNHIILDFNHELISYSNYYWIFKYLTFFKKNKSSVTAPFYRSFFYKKSKKINLPTKLKNFKKFTLKFNFVTDADNLSQTQLNIFKKFIKPRIKIKNRNIFIDNFINNLYRVLNKNDSKIDNLYLQFLEKNKPVYKVLIWKNNKLFNIFNINFLKKEKIYTKLKYSRTPAYDIVSGGFAALFAAFLGFIITEKFGFELVDSGDFYFLFMYAVFLCFFLKLFLKLFSLDEFFYNPISYKFFLKFYRTIFYLPIKFIKKYYRVHIKCFQSKL